MQAKQVRAIVRSELRHRKVFMVLWGFGLVAISSLTVLSYSAVKDKASQLDSAFSSFSSTADSFFGTSDMFSPAGYLNSQLFYIVLPILFIILSISLASTLTKKEEENGTLELLLARPISRSNLLLAKAIAATLITVILGIIAFTSIYICSRIIDLDISSWYIALATLMMVMFSGSFGAIAFMFYMMHQKTTVLGGSIAVLVGLGGYVVSSLGAMVDSLAWAGKLFPYHYYLPSDYLSGHVGVGIIVYCIAIYSLSLVISAAGFTRRDIK